VLEKSPLAVVRSLSVAVALLASASTAHAQAAPDPDPWFGRDKALHFGASALIAAGGYGGTALLADSRGARLLVGGGMALAAGAGKELADLAGFGDPSWRDFTWDVVGTLAGLAVAYGLDLAIGGLDARHPPLAAPAVGARGLGVAF
jgi:putative lipoprotein